MTTLDDIKWFRFYNMDNGVNQHIEDTRNKTPEARAQLNACIDEDGSLQKRKGNANWQGGSTPYHASGVKGLVRGYTDLTGHEVNRGDPTLTVDKSATQYSSVFIGLQNEDIIHDHDEDGTWSKLIDHAGATVMRAVQWQNSRLYLFFGAGANAKRFGFNSDTDTAACIYDMNIPGKSIGSATGVGTGSGSGDVTAGYYCAAYSLLYGPYTDNNARNLQWAESVVSGKTAEFQILSTNDAYVINTLVAEASNAVRVRRVYMTEAQAGSGTAVDAQLYKVGDFRATGTTVSWTDVTHPTDLKVPAPTSEDTGSVKDLNVHYATAHNDRLFYVTDEHKDRIYFSNAGKPDETPDDNWFNLKYENTGIHPFLGDLVICMQSRIEVMRGWSPEEFGASKEIIDTSRGCIAPDSLAVVNVQGRPMLFFVGRRRYGKAAVYAWDGQEIHHIGRKVQGTMDSLSAANIAKMKGTAHGDRYFLGLGDDATCICYDTLRDSWHPWDDMDIGCWAKFEGPSDAGELYWGQSGAGGMVKKADDTTYETCTFRHYPPHSDLNMPRVIKSLRAFSVEIERQSLPLTVHLSFDGGATTKDVVIPAALTAGGWNHERVSGFVLNRTGDDTIHVLYPLGGYQFETISIGFDSEESGNYQILGASVGFTVIGTRLG